MSTVVTTDSDHKSLHSLSHTFGRGFNYTPVCTLLLSIYTDKHVLSFRLELTVYFSSQVLMANASDSICKSEGWKEQLQGLSNAQEWAPPFSSVSTTQDLAVCLTCSSQLCNICRQGFKNGQRCYEMAFHYEKMMRERNDTQIIDFLPLV